MWKKEWEMEMKKTYKGGEDKEWKGGTNGSCGLLKTPQAATGLTGCYLYPGGGQLSAVSSKPWGGPSKGATD
jgi:hypothetical protein